IVARHGGRLQPPGQGLALAGTDEARIAGSKHMLGALIGLDRFAPASLGPVAAGTPEHQPRVLAKECRRQRVDPGPRPFEQLAALVVDYLVKRVMKKIRTRNQRRSVGNWSRTLRVKYSRVNRERVPNAVRIRRRSSADFPVVARWNSCSPAAQPSVRRASSASSSGGKGSR